jgi:hypothetical protein
MLWSFSLFSIPKKIHLSCLSSLPQVLKEGRIIQAGKYDDLLQAGTDFNTLVSAHHEAIGAMDIPNHSSDESLSLDGSAILNKKCDASECSIESLAKEVQDSASASDQKAIAEKKKAKRSRKKQLVQEEERVRGRVSMKVYLSYMAAAYKGLLIPLIILAQASFQFLQIASNWWMAWANPQMEGGQPRVSPMVLLGVYMALAFGSSWFIFVRAVLVATFGLAAAQKLFLKMLRSVFRAPMSFFDSTPAGRILNRVSSSFFAGNIYPIHVLHPYMVDNYFLFLCFLCLSFMSFTLLCADHLQPYRCQLIKV